MTAPSPGSSRRAFLARSGAMVVAAGGLTGIAPLASARGFDPQPGASGVGDPLFPTLGNGGYLARHYDLRFDFTPVSYDFSATVRIDAVATQDLSAFNLDTDAHTIDRVTVDGRPAQFALSPGSSGQELTVTPGLALHRGRRFTIEVEYHGNGKDKRNSLTGWRFGADGGFAAAVQSSRADSFLPCNDTPSNKATWAFHLSAPAGYVATANGQLTRVDRRPDGSAVWHFALDDPMPTELLGIAVVKGTYLHGRSHTGLPLRHVVPAGEESTYGPIVARTADHLTWCERRFGPYPYRLYGLHIYGGYTDALENTTLTLMGTNWFKLNAAGHPTYENTMIHELVHQWFGDSVTPRDWQQAWLNEGPAVFYAALYSDEQGWSSLVEKMRSVYAKLDAVRAADGPPGLPKALGGTNIYDGGALVLYALRQQIGTRRFDHVMRTWHARNRHSTATTEMFIAHVVSLTREGSLGGFLRAWLYGATNPPMPGHPDWVAG